MVNKLAKNNSHESNPNNNNISEYSCYHHSENNYQKAAIEAFRLLSLRKQLHPHIRLEFDQDLCIRLVKAYDLSCTDCKLDCPQHVLELNR